MAFVRLSGVTYLDPELVHQSYVLFTGADGTTRLIDLNGSVVHSWPFAGVPPRILDPALNGGRIGDVGVQLSDSGDARGGIYANGTIGQLDWDGTLVWQWGKQAPGGAARQNHDWELLPNGNRLILVTVPRVVPGLGDAVVGDQGLHEVTPDGEIMWTWLAGDHLEEFGFSEAGWAALRETAARDPEDPWGYLEMNSAKTLGRNRWYDARLDTAFHPDNILVSLRKANVIALIDKSTGKIAWRFGPYYDAEAGSQHQRITTHAVPRPLDQTSGQHSLAPETSWSSTTKAAPGIRPPRSASTPGLASSRSTRSPRKSYGSTRPRTPGFRHGRSSVRSSATRSACPTATRSSPRACRGDCSRSPRAATSCGSTTAPTWDTAWRANPRSSNPGSPESIGSP
jgi:Arylsulfotransferase (ASST)